MTAGVLPEGSGARGAWRAAALTFGVLLVVYALTLAPGLTWWDAGELALAADHLGIPHPPGTPMYVAIARAWHLLLAGVPTVVATNVLSAVATAAGCALLAAITSASMQSVRTGVAAAVSAGVMTSIWRNATETEVYALVLLSVALVLGSAYRAGVTGDRRWRLVTIYALALGFALHPGVLVALPSALLLAWPRTPAPRAWTRWGGESMRGALMMALGASALALLLVRAWHDPLLNQGNPASLELWNDVVGRAQYGSAGIWPRRAPVWAQLGMVVQYLDWQFALGVSPSTEPTLLRGTVSLLALVVAGVGARAQWQRDRRTALAVGTLLLGGTIGAALALNFRTGWSFSMGHLLDGVPREVRERDYFFSFGFAAAGLWFGTGAVAVAQWVGARWPRAARWHPALTMAVVAVPVLLNWPATSRRRGDGALTERFARRVLEELPARAVFVATGDNELYPLWYLQGVDGVRPDVLVVAEPLLPAVWYRAELRRREALELGSDWPGVEAMRRRLVAEARKGGRAPFESLFASDSVVQALWSEGGALVHGHAEPFSRLAAAALARDRVVLAIK